MITTPEILAAKHCIFTLESAGQPQEIILIVGSCRCVAFLNYLHRYNESAGHPFRIHYIEPFYYSAEELDALQVNERMLSVIRSATIFIHEHFGNYGIFNTSREAATNIYQFEMEPDHDISIPNFHDRFILEGDWPACGIPTPENYAEQGMRAVNEFCELCQLTSFPEMGLYFYENWTRKRFFWRPNHTSAEFTLWLFQRMNEKFFQLPLSVDFYRMASEEDLFKSPCTEVTENDIRNYRLEWR